MRIPQALSLDKNNVTLRLTVSFFFFFFVEKIVSFSFEDKIIMLGFLTLLMVPGGITCDAFTQKSRGHGEKPVFPRCHHVHLLCSSAHVSLGILVPCVQHYRSDCILSSASAPQLRRETSVLQGLLQILTVVQNLGAVFLLRFLVVSVSTQTQAPLGPRLLPKPVTLIVFVQKFSTSSRSSPLSSSSRSSSSPISYSISDTNTP